MTAKISGFPELQCNQIPVLLFWHGAESFAAGNTKLIVVREKQNEA